MGDCCKPFRDKKITVLGLGLLGRGVGDVGFLAKCGADVIVTDRKSEKELAASVLYLRQYKNITFHLGGHQAEDFTHRDLVIKAAGVALDSREVAAARAAGVPVAMSTALFAKYAAETGAIIVGVTGTRGKSTVAHLMHHVLTKARRRAHLGGNVRGVSTLAMLPEIRSGDTAVLELDSWQLQGFGDLHISPHVSVMTNLMPDHLDYYPDTNVYFSDKANIFRYQKKGDVLIVGHAIAKRVSESHPPVAPTTALSVPSDWKLRMVGAHNRENASLTAAALSALGVPESDIRAGLESFEGLEGRLQFLGQIDGVGIYNDNNATTPEATMAALRTLDSSNLPSPRAPHGRRKNIVLIAGGADKGLDMSSLVTEMRNRCKKVLLLAGTGTERIKKELPDAPILHGLDEAFVAALAAAEPGNVVVFSPAFASFGMFKNEYDRNDRFIELVRARSRA